MEQINFALKKQIEIFEDDRKQTKKDMDKFKMLIDEKIANISLQS